MEPRDLELYRVAVEARICPACLSRDPHGACGRPADSPCALRTHLGPLVEAILSVGGSTDLGEYTAAIRRLVCPNCRQDETGWCALRAVSECTPNAYLIPLVEVVEDVARRAGHGAWKPVAS